MELRRLAKLAVCARGARKLVQSKFYHVEMSLRGILRGFGLKVGRTTPKRFGGRVRELVAGHPVWTR
jgi:transposase